jgi:hypothetical protein
LDRADCAGTEKVGVDLDVLVVEQVKQSVFECLSDFDLRPKLMDRPHGAAQHRGACPCWSREMGRKLRAVRVACWTYELILDLAREEVWLAAMDERMSDV